MDFGSGPKLSGTQDQKEDRFRRVVSFNQAGGKKNRSLLNGHALTISSGHDHHPSSAYQSEAGPFRDKWLDMETPFLLKK